MTLGSRSRNLHTAYRFTAGLSFLCPFFTAEGQVARLSAADRSSVVAGVAEQLKAAYFDPQAAQRISELLDARLKSGAYDKSSDPAEFARQLTSHMREVNGDLHLTVQFSARPTAERVSPSRPTAAEVAERRENAAWVNFGFSEVRVLRGNIAYVRFDNFYPFAWSDSTLTVIRMLTARTQALILDLRYNSGGEADMADSMTAFLSRRSAPTFVLTSGGSASAAEAVAYHARDRRSATLVGEKTLGAGNAGTSRRINRHFAVFVPVVRAAWDGVGVPPHVDVPAEAALETAHALAAAQLAQMPWDSATVSGFRYLSESATIRASEIRRGLRAVPFDSVDAHAISGRYAYPNSVLSVWSDGGQVFAQMEGRARRYTFTRRADGAYASRDRVTVRFSRDDSGTVDALIWFEGGRYSPARRLANR